MVITSACHAEVPSSILGNSVKDVYCNFLQKNFGVAGSIPVSLTYETVAQLEEHVVWQMPGWAHILLWQKIHTATN